MIDNNYKTYMMKQNMKPFHKHKHVDKIFKILKPHSPEWWAECYYESLELKEEKNYMSYSKILKTHD